MSEPAPLVTFGHNAALAGNPGAPQCEFLPVLHWVGAPMGDRESPAAGEDVPTARWPIGDQPAPR